MSRQYETVIGLEVHVELAKFSVAAPLHSEELPIPIPARYALECRVRFQY